MDQPLQPSAAHTRWPAPFVMALASSAVAALVVALVLHAVPGADGSEEHERALTLTPERAAESFIAAYTTGSYERAAHFATRSFARTLRALARQERLSGDSKKTTPARALSIEESFFLTQSRMRLTGVATSSDGNAAAGPPVGQAHDELADQNAPAHDDWPVSLILSRDGDRFLVDELSWPRGEPPEAL